MTHHGVSTSTSESLEDEAWEHLGDVRVSKEHSELKNIGAWYGEASYVDAGRRTIVSVLTLLIIAVDGHIRS